jgi:hypothetical protein
MQNCPSLCPRAIHHLVTEPDPSGIAGYDPPGHLSKKLYLQDIRSATPSWYRRKLDRPKVLACAAPRHPKFARSQISDSIPCDRIRRQALAAAGAPSEEPACKNCSSIVEIAFFTERARLSVRKHGPSKTCVFVECLKRSVTENRQDEWCNLLILTCRQRVSAVAPSNTCVPEGHTAIGIVHRSPSNSNASCPRKRTNCSSKSPGFFISSQT